jgi:hypothetical protein
MTASAILRIVSITSIRLMETLLVPVDWEIPTKDSMLTNPMDMAGICQSFTQVDASINVPIRPNNIALCLISISRSASFMVIPYKESSFSDPKIPTMGRKLIKPLITKVREMAGSIFDNQSLEMITWQRLWNTHS